MPQRGQPFDPEDPEGESTFQMSIDPKLLPKPDYPTIVDARTATDSCGNT